MSVELRFHAALYSQAALRSAGEAFAELASVRVRDGAPYRVVTLRPKRGAPETVAEEYANYALGLMRGGA